MIGVILNNRLTFCFEFVAFYAVHYKNCTTHTAYGGNIDKIRNAFYSKSGLTLKERMIHCGHESSTRNVFTSRLADLTHGAI